MQEKKQKLIDKIYKKNYNNRLEEILENKSFNEDAKSFLLSMLYKIEIGYKDLKKVKVDVDTKDEYIEKFLEVVENNCNNIELLNLLEKEKYNMGNKTYEINVEEKIIRGFPIDRKIIYAIYKMNKKEMIVKEKYEIIDKTISHMINVGNNIDKVEIIRDFNRIFLDDKS